MNEPLSEKTTLRELDVWMNNMACEIRLQILSLESQLQNAQVPYFVAQSIIHEIQRRRWEASNR